MVGSEVLEYAITRQKIKSFLEEKRIFLSTIASLNSKREILKLIDFDLIIVDEASQILEPQLIGLLSHNTKFVLIGDHKQLPAIVLQNSTDSKVTDNELMTIGLNYFHNSIFERLYKNALRNQWDDAYDQLETQGRMHRDIMHFPATSFYNDISMKILPGELGERQRTVLNKDMDLSEKSDFQKLLANNRLLFFGNHDIDKSIVDKANSIEADLIIQILKDLRIIYGSKLHSEDKTIGIITPYKNQIALIKDLMEEMDIPERDKIAVDTVERFQGGQHNIIIISFAIESPYLLEGLVKLDDSGTVDRKLNVAMTRAKDQLIMLGNPSLLSLNIIYYRLIEFIKSRGGYFEESFYDIIKGHFNYSEASQIDEPIASSYKPDEEFSELFEELVIDKLKNDERTINYPADVSGFAVDEVRNNIIEYGRTEFDIGYQSPYNSLKASASDKVNYYCYLNMRKHYFSSLRIFEGWSEYLTEQISRHKGKIYFIDFGCGPLTAGLAFQRQFAELDLQFTYLGIDISDAMIDKAKTFAERFTFKNTSKFHFTSEFIPNEIMAHFSDSSLVLFNFSFFFSNLSGSQTEVIANKINECMNKLTLNKYLVIFQNPASERRNYNYHKIFKPILKMDNQLPSGKIETISYKNQLKHWYDKSETFYYEILSN